MFWNDIKGAARPATRDRIKRRPTYQDRPPTRKSKSTYLFSFQAGECLFFVPVQLADWIAVLLLCCKQGRDEMIGSQRFIKLT